VVSLVTQLLYPQGKSVQHPTDRRLGGPRTGLDAVAIRKNLFPASAIN